MNKKEDLGRIGKYAEIFRDLRASDIMTRTVTTLTADKKMCQAKEMMRIKKVSGLPVVDGDGVLRGIISIEDIINALDQGTIQDSIEAHMTADPITIDQEEDLASIVEKFDKFKVGRFPVISPERRVIGIISRVDILHGVLDKFNLIYIHDQHRSKTLEQEFSPITGERLDAEKAEFHYPIEGSDITLAGTGAAMLKQFLKQKGIDPDITRRAGIVTYEAETNVVIHSKSRGDIYCFTTSDSIIIRVVDSGIGIEDMEKAMIEGFSTASDYVREYGFGAGMGIPNMKKFADKLVILSEKNVGTQLEIAFYLNP